MDAKMKDSASSGDHYVTAEEFYNLPEGTHAELIDGVLYYPPYGQAAPARRHQDLVSIFNHLIRDYIINKGGNCRVYPAPFDVQLNENEDSVVQPDISVICDPAKLTDKGCTGAPDWIIEIVSPKSGAYDYIKKLKKYLDAGVREYWIVDPTVGPDPSKPEKPSPIGFVTVYDLTSERLIPREYSFNDKVKVGIYDDLYIDFSEITAQL